MPYSNQYVLHKDPFADIRSTLEKLYFKALENDQIKHFEGHKVRTQYALVNTEYLKRVADPKTVDKYISKMGWATCIFSREKYLGGTPLQLLIVFEDLIPEEFHDWATVYLYFRVADYGDHLSQEQICEHALKQEYEEAKAMGKLGEIREWIDNEIKNPSKPCLVPILREKKEDLKPHSKRKFKKI